MKNFWPVILLLLVLGCKPPPAPPVALTPAPELVGAMTWLNGREVKLAGLKGKVVLIHFFDYSSVACQPEFAVVKRWEKQFGGSGLVVVGVQSPVHDFAMNPINVHAGLDRLGVAYPVALDSSAQISERYGRPPVPAIALVDRDGMVRLIRSGPSQIVREEQLIQQALASALPPGALLWHGTNTVTELRLGAKDGALGNQPAVSTNGVTRYSLPSALEEMRVYAVGAWSQQGNLLHHTEDAEDEMTDGLVVRYGGSNVYLVMRPEALYWKQVFVRQDGQWLPRRMAGPDIEYDEQGRSFVKVEQSRVYHLVAAQLPGRHELRLTTRGKSLSVYSISFD